MDSTEALKILDDLCGDYIRMLVAQSPCTARIVQREALKALGVVSEAISPKVEPNRVEEHG